MQTDNSSDAMPLSADEVVKAIETGLPGLDASRTAGYAQLGQLRDAKARSLSREQTLLARKHGGAPHPRIAEARQRFAINEQLRRETAIIREVSETPLAEPEKNALIVHGFVRRRSDHVGIPGLTLALTDSDGNWLRQFGYACTDQRGYFLLRANLGSEEGRTGSEESSGLKTSADVSVEEARREAEAAARRGEKPAGESAGGPRIDAKRPAQLRVFDAKGHVVHTEKRPVLLRAGTVDYRYILLGDEAGECACSPPPSKAGGRPSSGGPKPPAEPVAPKPIRQEPMQRAPASHVGTMKQYEQPAIVPPGGQGAALETIRGIGPRTADKLRKAGIADVEEYAKTPGAEFVKIAGFDKTTPKPARGKKSAEETTPARKAVERKAPTKKSKKK